MGGEQLHGASGPAECVLVLRRGGGEGPGGALGATFLEAFDREEEPGIELAGQERGLDLRPGPASCREGGVAGVLQPWSTESWVGAWVSPGVPGNCATDP